MPYRSRLERLEPVVCDDLDVPSPLRPRGIAAPPPLTGACAAPRRAAGKKKVDSDEDFINSLLTGCHPAPPSLSEGLRGVRNISGTRCVRLVRGEGRDVSS
jgi:hypothetical protein